MLGSLFNNPIVQPSPPATQNAGGGSWWDDTTNFIGSLADSASQLWADSWLNDQFGTPGDTQTAIERPQSQNADVSNAPSVAFGFSQTQLMIGGVVAVIAIIALKRK